ncbi:MAG TPA: peptide chain release factor 2 [Candidatus Aphodocola excrementigallinarum]|uniref:Peptide chain release factor 2 n=1 Tax=Candidatus Aphodocola excrementigallinarum TaxID=2840670 RepID=A0A9D1INP3_9FIRM|nr:peptide chain release factor 2 [Candidatus Aphodocola excrementigallinarum]
MYGGFFEVEKKNQKINELSEELNDPNIWNNPSNAEKITKELSDLKKLVAPVIKIKENVEVLKQFNEFSSLEMDEELKLQFESLFKETSELLKKEEILTYLSGKYDNNPAIFEIHAGAGGTESCDWVAMLARMYTKYFDKKGYSYEMIDKQDGEEAGFKSVVYIVKGSYAYGYLKNEKGVHRLVRLSPFDSNNRRHTSFAAVDVIPEFDNNIDINLNEKDLRIDVYRSTGAGGQGVNTTDSAVRITHLPTGIVVTCQNERSQLKNKETALKVLKSKLYQIELKKRQDAVNNIKKDHNEIEFGSQIRSYVLHPYSMIKDHRTGYETSNVNKVLDGDLDGFIESNLKGEKQDETI